MADTQELQRLALVSNLMDRSLSMPDTDYWVADLRRLNRYRVVYIVEITFTYIFVFLIIPNQLLNIINQFYIFENHRKVVSHASLPL